MSVLAFGCFALAFSHWYCQDPLKFTCYLALAIAASFLKIKLPGVNGTLSVNFIFVLLGVLELSFGETLLLGIAEVFVQSRWRSSKNLKPIHVIFNASQFSVGTAAAYGMHQLITQQVLHGAGPVALIVVAITYFGFNTLSVATIVWLTEGKPILKTWSESYFWSFPYYLAGAAITGLMTYLNQHIGWQSSLLIFPPVYLMYRSYRLYLGKLEDEKRHAEQVSRVHLRTIEALALAIEAKDQTTHDHLQRVRVYAMELARELGLSEGEKEALQAASVLHDIGKLAVPEHIISKPGKLTPEEFEKMKIHPIIGAEILEQVDFPYPVVPIVRAHHEKWDGSGYPDGLAGEAIPIGARILAAVDCLDALASDRQYRRALPLDEAIARVSAEAGKAFDPRIVEILARRYIELERMAKEQPGHAPAKLSTDIKVERGLAPAAGFAEAESAIPAEQTTGLQPVAPSNLGAALLEAQYLFELGQAFPMRLEDLLSMLAARLKRLVPHDAIAVYLLQNEVLVPEFVSGDNARVFASLRIPEGEGLSGWVAENRKPILNGNPSVEPGYLNDPTKYSTLRSALAVPLEGSSGVVAVLALYRAQADAFSREDLRILLVIASKLALTVERILKSKSAEDEPLMDSLTGLPNAQSLFVHLDREIARAQAEKLPLAVLITDLDGFSRINEEFGSAQGNRFLQAFAVSLKRACGPQAYAARMGGDEFAVVVPGLRQESALDLGNNIQRAATESARHICDATLTLSLGQAFYPADGENAEQLLAAADRQIRNLKNLHAAKAALKAAAHAAGLD
ncbi:MAG TPA: HD domain-containing phosphohydrolase [Terriglobales bacterium]|nr:HD domain-containing phosphohydrolase [Terriglobales bacterium]